METAAKLNYFPAKGGCMKYFSPQEILHHVKLDYNKQCSVPLLQHCSSMCIGLSFLCAVHIKQGGYECYHISTRQVITQPYITVVPATPAIIVTIDTLCKSDSIQNLKITNLCGHLLFDSMDPALLAGVDDDDDDTSLVGVQGDDTSLAGVPIPIMINNANDDNSDAESDHNSVDPNEANDNSSKASLHSTRIQAPVHNTTDEPPQLPPDEEELDNMDDTQLPEQETQVPTLC